MKNKNMLIIRILYMKNIDISISYNFFTTSSNNNRKNKINLAFHYNNFYKKFHELMSELNKIKIIKFYSYNI